jgi:hypothetical protein
VSGTGSGTLYVVVTSSNPAVAAMGPITLGSSSASAEIIPAALQTLGPGLHTATITVRACLNDASCASNQINGSPQTVAVTYRIFGTLSTASSLAFNIGNAPPQPADLARAFTVSSYPAEGWTVTTDLQMLNVTPATGGAAIATAVNASIDAASLDSFGGGNYTGHIRFTPNAVGQIPFDLPVTIDIARTRVNFVAPHVAVTGSPNEVIIRGEFLNAAAPTGVLFGSTPATSFTVVSDTEIRATHPALPVGAHTVHVSNAQGIDRTTAVLHVIAAGAMPAASLDYPDGADAIPLHLIHDARRSALLVNVYHPAAGQASNQIVRYANSNGAWQQTARALIPYRSAIALSADGNAIFVAHGAAAMFSVDELDPVTLLVARTTGASNSYHEGFSMAVANDGNAVIETNLSSGSTSFAELIFSPLRRTIEPMIRPGGRATIPPMRQHSGATVASGDGSSVLIGDTQNQRTVRYVSGDLEASWFDPTFAVNPYFLQLVMNRRGDLMVSREDGVRDANFSLIGRLPNTTRLFGISPELPRAYSFDEAGTLRVFDVSAPVVNGFLAELTPAITPAADPDAMFGTAPLVISPDSLTAFVAGRARLIVQPIQ